MKKFSIALSALFLCISISCNDDNNVSGSGSQEVADQQNALEDNKTDVATLENGIIIDGATKESGNPPSPNSNLDFNISNNSQKGFQSSGFDIKFSSNADVAGAYIRFKDVDGNATSDYFNVPASSFGASFSNKGSFANSAIIDKKIESTSLVSKNSESVINVDLKTTVPAGEFCYDICIYDNQNNVSTIETVCVTIEAWGGNAQLVGKWRLEEITDFDDTFDIDCNNGGTINVSESNIISQDILVYFNEDGSYNDSQKGETGILDYNASVETCTVVYTPDTEKMDEERFGNWAFEEDDNRITIVLFSIKDLLDSNNSVDYEFGDKFFDGLFIKEITDTKLVIEEVSPFGFEVTYVFKRI